MKINVILVVGFLLMVFLVGSAGFISIGSINKIESSFRETTEDSVPVTFSLIYVDRDFIKMREDLIEYAVSRHDKDRDDFYKALDGYRVAVGQIKYYEGGDIEEDPYGPWAELADRLDQVEIEMLGISDKIFGFRDPESLNGVSVLELDQIEELELVEDVLRDILDERTRHELEELEEQKEAVFEGHKEAERTIIIFNIFSFAWAIFLVFFMSRLIVSPIRKLTNIVEEISKGKLDVQLPITEITEVRQLTDSLNRVLSSLKLAILKSKKGHGECEVKKVAKPKVKTSAGLASKDLISSFKKTKITKDKKDALGESK